MTAIWALLAGIAKSIPWWAWLVVIILISGWFYGESKERIGFHAGEAKIQAQFDEYRSKMVDLTQKAAAAAQKARETYHDEHVSAEDAYQAGRNSAKHAESVTVSDLRAGNLRLREQWRSCMSSAGTKTPSDTASGPDGSADLWPEAAGRAVRIGDDADSHVTWLQSELIATRKLAESCAVLSVQR